jgi:hypothetical protein
VSHFARTQLDATWTTGNYVTLVADWQSLGAKVFAAINGDLGGAWAPTSPIVLNGTLGVAAINFGTVLIDYGGSVTVGASATVLVSGVSGGWPVFVAGHAKQSRSIQHSWLERQATPLYHWANNIVAGGVQSIACTIQSASLVATVVQGQPLVGGIAHLAGTSRSLNELVSGSTSVDAPTFTSQSILQQPRMLLPLRVHDGARLTSATLTFGVSTPRQAGPIVAPRLRIFRADLSGNIVPLASIAAGADERGFLPIATPTNGPAWYANGAVQTFIYPCDQNNVVDVSQYLYFAELVEEVATLKPIAVTACDGVLVRERKADVDVASIGANIALTGTYTLDGVALAIGSMVLAKDQTDPRENGLYYVPGASAWTRLQGLTTPQDFTPSFLVRVKSGAVNAGTMWECAGPTSAQSITLASGTGTPITFQLRKPRGNIYVGLAVAFDSTADMRWE